MSPVEAHATARIATPWRIICRTRETSTVIPRSLNEPVWELPQSFTHRSLTPSSRPNRSAQKRLVPPSSMDTMLSASTPGQTHSFLPQTEDPYGQVVRL